MSEPQAPSNAHYFLEGLDEIGLDYIFANLGTDHVSLIEESARWAAQGRRHPRWILCPHENVALHMAAGYAAVTGQGQAVLVHVDSGTANSAMGMHNMFRGRLPVLLMAGKAPYTLRGELPGSRDNYVHFVQDPFDIGSLVRPYVKWEHNLSTGINAKEVLRRAHSVMHSDPPGPVFLTLPRETLAEAADPQAARPFDAARYGAVRQGGVDAARVQQLVDQLMAAQSPMVVTSYLGRRPEAVAALQDLALLCGIRVYEFNPSFLCIDRSSPCFSGFDPAGGLREADLGWLLDVDVPWLPKFAQVNPATRWAHIDVDPIKQDFPMWGFATDLRVQADCATVLRQVEAHVRAHATPAFHEAVARRLQGWAPARQARLESARRAAADPGRPDAISPAWFCAALGAALDPRDIVVNEAIRNAPAVLQQIARSEPLSLISSAGGGLGYSGGMALGARLARPEARVVQIVGDGGFHFSTPTSVYATSQTYGLPILTIVLDNGGWQAVKEAVLRVYPDGAAARGNEFQARLQGQQRHFEQVAQAFGAHGERVNEPGQVAGALSRALAALDAGRSALLNVQIGLQ